MIAYALSPAHEADGAPDRVRICRRFQAKRLDAASLFRQRVVLLAVGADSLRRQFVDDVVDAPQRNSQNQCFRVNNSRAVVAPSSNSLPLPLGGSIMRPPLRRPTQALITNQRGVFGGSNRGLHKASERMRTA